jgi:hypothetical protein
MPLDTPLVKEAAYIPETNTYIQTEWPQKIQLHTSTKVTVKLSGINKAGIEITPELPENKIALETAVPVGTPGVPLAQAYGSNNDATVSAFLVGGSGYDIQRVGDTVAYPLKDAVDITWDWLITPKSSSDTFLTLRIDITWTNKQTKEEIKRDLYRKDFDIKDAIQTIDVANRLVSSSTVDASSDTKQVKGKDVTGNVSTVIYAFLSIFLVLCGYLVFNMRNKPGNKMTLIAVDQPLPAEPQEADDPALLRHSDDELKGLLEVHTKSLAVVTKQLARFGWLYAPPYKITEKNEIVAQITAIERELRRREENLKHQEVAPAPSHV